MRSPASPIAAHSLMFTNALFSKARFYLQAEVGTGNKARFSLMTKILTGNRCITHRLTQKPFMTRNGIQICGWNKTSFPVFIIPRFPLKTVLMTGETKMSFSQVSLL